MGSGPRPVNQCLWKLYWARSEDRHKPGEFPPLEISQPVKSYHSSNHHHPALVSIPRCDPEEEVILEKEPFLGRKIEINYGVWCVCVCLQAANICDLWMTAIETEITWISWQVGLHSEQDDLSKWYLASTKWGGLTARNSRNQGWSNEDVMGSLHYWGSLCWSFWNHFWFPEFDAWKRHYSQNHLKVDWVVGTEGVITIMQQFLLYQQPCYFPGNTVKKLSHNFLMIPKFLLEKWRCSSILHL